MKIKGKFVPCKTALLPYVVALAFCGHAAHAFEIQTDDPDLKIRWDNTFKYSSIYRLQDPDATQLALYKGSPAGDGERNFKKGLASSRLDLLSEFDITKQNMGARISADAFFDSMYYRNNSNTTGLSHNLTVPSNQYTADTRSGVGSNFRLMDAFAYTKGNIGDMQPASESVAIR